MTTVSWFAAGYIVTAVVLAILGIVSVGTAAGTILGLIAILLIGRQPNHL